MYACYTRIGRGIILEQAVYRDGYMIAYHCCPSPIIIEIQEGERVHFVEKSSLEEITSATLTNAKGAKKMLCNNVLLQIKRMIEDE